MAADRDIGVLVVRALRSIGVALARGWEMTAATGVRGIRIAREAGPFERFWLTEASPAAASVLRENASRHPELVAVEGDARKLPRDAPFDYVDLDPYGSPIPFIPTALAAVRADGILAVTATDLMVLAGAQRRACLEHYRSEPVRGRLGPEGGLRILLAYLAGEASRLGRGIRPLLAYVRDHHVRAYLSVSGEPLPPPPVGVIDPFTWKGPPVGVDGPYGPLWLGPLFSPELIRAFGPTAGLEHPKEVGRWVDRLREECAVDVPFYYEGNTLAGALGLATPPSVSALFGGLQDRGYRVAHSHVRAGAFRTNAPRTLVERVARAVGAP